MYILQETSIIKYDLPLSIDEYNLNTVKLFPNPTSDYVSISNVSLKKDYTIYDITGRQIQQDTYQPSSKIDISNFTNGTYILMIDGQSKKIIKQ
jgi:hypothetical protein